MRPCSSAALALALVLSSFTLGNGQTAPAASRTVLTDSFVKLPPAKDARAADSAAMTDKELDSTVEFMVSLKMRRAEELRARAAAGDTVPAAEMQAKYYPAAEDYQTVAAWLKAQGFTVKAADPLHLGVTASGTIRQIKAAFAVEVARVVDDGKVRISAATAPSVPSDLAPLILGVNGLQPHLHPHKHRSPIRLSDIPPGGGVPPFGPQALYGAYNVPTGTLDGTGQTIGIVIDTFPNDSDLTTFWADCGIPQTLSNIQHVAVTTNPLSAVEGEETLDVSWSSAMAPGAKIRVYATGDLSDVAIDQAYQQIITDAPTVQGLHQVSLSYGQGEVGASTSQLQTDSQYFASMVTAGVTVFASSGDGGSSPGPGGHDHTGPTQVEAPADDPNVIAVGGTSLYLNPDNSVQSETAWYDGGGGVSVVFTRPSWQTGTGVPSGTARAVPDVAAVADPNTGVFLVLNGQTNQYGGTSLSSPVWAGFCALLNQARANAGQGPVGSLGPKIYPLLGTNDFRDITLGNNGDYYAGQGYDECTGIGVPNVTALAAALTGTPIGGGELPNLTFYKPSGWSSNVTVTTDQNITTDSPLLLTSDTLYVSFAPWNNGQVAVGSPWTAQILVDGTVAQTISFDAGLAPTYYYNAIDNYSIGSLPAGNHTVTVILDTGNAVAESDETDNVFQKTITVTPNTLPNLTFYEPAGWSDDVVVTNEVGDRTDSYPLLTTDTLYVSLAPQNDGTVTAASGWKARVYVDNALAADVTVTVALQPGYYATNTVDEPIGSLSAGTHIIKVLLDATNVIGELDENDNAYYKVVTVQQGGQPNLTFYQPAGWSDKVIVSNSPYGQTDSDPLLTTDTLYVGFAPTNVGTLTAPGGWDAEIYVDGVPTYDSQIYNDLDPNYYFNDQYGFSIGSLPAGTHQIQVVLDVYDDVDESDKSDNSYTKTITVEGSGGGTSHPGFFTGEVPLGNGVYFLTFLSGNPFGYYSYLSDPNYIYHFDLGYEYVFDAADGRNGVYFYDFTSSDFFYTSPGFPFPYLYDFGLNSVVYYYPDPSDFGHYNTNGVRYFYVFNTGQIISK